VRYSHEYVSRLVSTIRTTGAFVYAIQYVCVESSTIRGMGIIDAGV
jgi:hypothetical protein